MSKIMNKLKCMLHNLLARCMKCKEQKIIKNLKFITTKNNRNAATGICPMCGTKLFRFLPKDFEIKSYPENEPDIETEIKIETPENANEEIKVKKGKEIKKGKLVAKENEKAIPATPANSEEEAESFDEVSM